MYIPHFHYKTIIFYVHVNLLVLCAGLYWLAAAATYT